jgi:pimeloyl-ACP methyl ester carboxylesterase
MIFLHGLESSSQTYKASVIRNSFPDLIVPDFTGPLSERMQALYPIIGKQQNWTIIGSSFGGVMGAIFTCQHPDQVRKLVMLAPALMLPEFAPFIEGDQVAVPTTIIHGRQDDVVSLAGVREIAEKVFVNLMYTIVDDDHRLHATTDRLAWREILA